MNFNLAVPFHEQARQQPEAPALVVEGASWSYGELASLASRVAAWLGRTEGRASGRVGILAARSLEAYVGVLGTLWAGQAYVPVNPHTPEDRLLRIFQMAELDALVVDQAGMDLLSERALASAPRRILAGRDVRPSQAAAHAAGIQINSFANLPEAEIDGPVEVGDGDLAYVLFTSGTTGTPKGVMIEAGSVAQFRSVVQQRCVFTPSDRVSQVAELTFDNSVLDLFVTWAAGAELHVVPEAQLMAPAKFIREHALTVWFSVPSTACMMDRMRMLKAGAFPSLRLSIFAGEALPIAAARAWQKAAPNSVVENFYGPTEVTVDCIAQRLEEPPNITRNRGSLAIGKPFPGIEAGIVDAELLRFLPPEQEGELVVSGRQVARGYFQDAELTAARFPTIDGRRWYRTGDLAYQDAAGAFHHLGRIDNQVKVLGNRVELEEVEAHLREIVGSDVVAAVAWPVEDGRATGIVAFHCDAAIGRDQVREGMQRRVPAYMVPQRVCRVDNLPLGSTGKIDRKALVQLLKEGKI